MKVYVADLEANGLLAEATKVWCGVFKNILTGEVKKFQPDMIQSMLNFMDTIDVLIMHNGFGYDWPLLRQLYGYEFKGKKVDTLLMSRLQRPHRQVPANCPNKKSPHSVESWGYRVGRGKPDHDDWSKYTAEMLHRCSEDVEIQHLIYNALIEEGRGEGWRTAHLLTFSLFDNLHNQQDYGWLVDQPHIHTSIALLTKWIGKIDDKVTPYLPLLVEIEETKTKGEYAHVKKPFKKDGTYNKNICEWMDRGRMDRESRPITGPFSRVSFRHTNVNSNKEIKEFLLQSGWEPAEWNTNDEGDRTSPKLSKDDPFDGVQGSLGKLIAKRVQCTHRRSVLEGWLKVIRPDGRISSVVSGLAVTGRAKHKTIANVPRAGSFFGKHMRQCFIAKPGWQLVGTDSDACQIRMLAGRMNDEGYTNTVLNGDKDAGTDIHTVNQFAANLDSRDDAKTFFYGFLFGAGDGKVGKIVGGTARDGARLKAQFLAGLPALAALLEALTAEWKSHAKQKWNAKFGRMEWFNGWVTGLDGRPIYIPSEHMILVYVLQSDEAIMMSAAYNIFHKWMANRGYVFGEHYGTVCWYHDEWTVECPPELTEEVSQLAEKAIEWAGAFYNIPCPHKGNAAVGNNWYEIH